VRYIPLEPRMRNPMARKPRKSRRHTGSYLSARTKANIEKALEPVIQQLKQQMATGSTEPIHCPMELDMDDAPGMFDFIVDECHDTIVQTAFAGDAIGQSYVVAMEERHTGVMDAGVMLFGAADLYFANPPESRVAWEEYKVKVATFPHLDPVIIASSTFGLTNFRFIPKFPKPDPNRN
jgi:hypothetical protein